METMNPTKEEIKLLIENALLQNNERINSTIQASADKTMVAIKETTDTYLEQLTKLAANQGSLQSEVSDLRLKVNNLWAKVIGVGAACATLTGLVVFIWQH